MIADKSINLDTLHKVLFDNEKLKLSEECIRKVEAVSYTHLTLPTN